MDSVKDYVQDLELIKQFLKEYTFTDNNGGVSPKYAPILTDIANRDKICLFVELEDLEQFNNTLARNVCRNTVRYNQLFHEALDELLHQFKTKEPEVKEVMDVFIEQRLFVSERNSRANNNNNNNQSNASGPSAVNNLTTASDPMRMKRVDIDGMYPPDLIRRAEIFFKPTTFQATPIRDVKAQLIGKLTSIRGIVTRTTDVKPKITIATYTCDQCGCETFQPIKGIDFTPLFECSSAACKTSKNVGRISFQMRGSKFIKYQEIKIQEHSDQVPTGHIPRTMTVIAYGEQTRRCTPGDHISVSGVFLPLEKSGYRLRSGGLAVDTYFEAHYISKMNKTEDEELNNDPLSEETARQLINGDPDFLNKLSKSIAPEIYGHNELKQALLLLLVGGVDKTSFGLKIRGNINICLMGDPGVAKSQLLSFIDRLAPRSQYTSGRGSSGVGLTAAVLKDPITNELVLEGGALVLADEGICCIDEFDKMMEADRTAIHEVMEQQTVSIAKAGIMTTLNARVSILAAANPAYGRYNVHRSIADNLQLPPALLSRFDLLWLIKDSPDKSRDLNLAQHITDIHSNPSMVANHDQDTIDMKTMRRYLMLCKQKKPTVPERLSDRLVKIYLEIRNKRRINPECDALFTSPRSLLAIIRLSTAFARLRLSEEVDESDIDKAVMIYNCSRESIEGAIGTHKLHDMDIIKIIRSMSANLKSLTIPAQDIRQSLRSKGFAPSHIEDAFVKLEEFDFINYDKASDDITLIDQVMMEDD